MVRSPLSLVFPSPNNPNSFRSSSSDSRPFFRSQGELNFFLTANWECDTEKSTAGLSLLSHMALKILKSIHLLQTSLTAEVGSGGGSCQDFYVFLFSFGNIKFHSHLKMHLIAFTSDTSPFFPSYDVTAISQQAAKKKNV